MQETTESGGLYAEFCTPCSEGDCAKAATTRGLCNPHYQRWYHSEGFRPGNRRSRCGVEACERPRYQPRTHRADDNPGFCLLHFERWAKSGDPLLRGFASTQLRKPRIVNIGDYTSPTALGRALGVSKQRAHQILNPQSQRARAAVAQALEDGRILKPASCERCDKRMPALEAHHWDYRERLDVRWLCRPCHNIVHPHGNPVGRRGLAQAVAQHPNPPAQAVRRA